MMRWQQLRLSKLMMMMVLLKENATVIATRFRYVHAVRAA
jgi:hypothetical protein